MDQHPTSPPDTHRDSGNNKDIAALGYVWVLAVFVLVYARSSAFARFHARQGVVLFALSIVSWFLPDVLGRMLLLCILLLSVWGFLAAAQGLYTQLPFVYALSCGDFRALRTSWRTTVQAIVGVWHRLRNKTGDTRQSGAQSDADTSVPPTHPL